MKRTPPQGGAAPRPQAATALRPQATPKQNGAKAARKPAEPRPGRSNGTVDYDLLQALLGYALRRTQLAVFQHFARSMAAIGEDRVSPGEFGVLVLVEANPGINQTSLANAVGADRSTMVPIIDRLERRGLLERQAVPGDRRAHALRLAKSGKERMARFRHTVIEHERHIGADLTAAERQVLLDLLLRLRQAGETA